MNDQGISIPYQALYGLKSLIVFYQPFFPSTNQNAQTTAYLITDQCYHGISLNLARFGQIGTVGEGLLATDRLVGNAAVGFNVSSGGTSYEYPYGRPATGYLMQTALTNYFNCTAGAGQIGMSANGQARTGFPGLFYGAVGFSVNLTAAQMQQAVQYGEALLQRNGVGAFIDSTPPALLIYSGDSKMSFYPNGTIVGSTAWNVSNLEPDREQYYQFGVASKSLAAINTSFPNVEGPLLRKYATASKVVIQDALDNDLNTCLTGPTCFGIVQQYGANVWNYGPGTSSVYITSPPGNGSTPANWATASATNALVISNMMAGTLNYSAVDDMATDPIAATQTAPNAYALTGYPSFTVTGATQSTAAVTNSLNLATVAPAQSCYPGATWTVAGMTPSGYNGTFTLATGSGPYASGCLWEHHHLRRYGDRPGNGDGHRNSCRWATYYGGRWQLYQQL